MNDNRSNTAAVIVEKWDNVIPFKRPEKKSDRKEVDIIEIEDKKPVFGRRRTDAEETVELQKEKLRKRLDQMVEHHSSELFEGLHIAGIEFDESNHTALNDFFFITESLRSALYRLHGLEHEIQDIVDEDFSIDDSIITQAIGMIDAPILTQEQLDELLNSTSENPDYDADTDVPD
jgi:hypothetical protein